GVSRMISTFIDYRWVDMLEGYTASMGMNISSISINCDMNVNSIIYFIISSTAVGVFVCCQYNKVRETAHSVFDFTEKPKT
ncbi:hypothetical protein ACJX0J_012328, partial [Zea mays]